MGGMDRSCFARISERTVKGVLRGGGVRGVSIGSTEEKKKARSVRENDPGPKKKGQELAFFSLQEGRHLTDTRSGKKEKR